MLSSVQSLSLVWLFVTHWLEHASPPCPPPACGAYSDSCPSSRGCHPTVSPSVISSSCLQSFPASGSFPMSRFLHKVAKVLEFQFQHQSFQWRFRTDSFRMDWFDVLVVQGSLKSLLQHHSSNASILRHSAFFTVQLSHPYMTTEKP